MRFSKYIIAICGIYYNENLVLHKSFASEFIIMACIDFFVVAITPITTTLIVIVTNFIVVLSFFFLPPCSDDKRNKISECKHTC